MFQSAAMNWNEYKGFLRRACCVNNAKLLETAAQTAKQTNSTLWKKCNDFVQTSGCKDNQLND